LYIGTGNVLFQVPAESAEMFVDMLRVLLRSWYGELRAAQQILALVRAEQLRSNSIGVYTRFGRLRIVVDHIIDGNDLTVAAMFTSTPNTASVLIR